MISSLLGLYIGGFIVVVFYGLVNYTDPYSKKLRQLGARLVLGAVVWPLIVLWLVGRELWRMIKVAL